MGMLELVQQKAFLGREFLTWLWFRSDVEPRIQLGDSRSVEVELMDSIMLDAHYGDAKSSVLRGESPGTSPEAAVALLEGKKLRRARFKLLGTDIDWTATIDGENFNLTGLKLPKVGKLPFEEVMQLRIDYIRDFEEIFQELFQTFLELRLDDENWAAELERIHTWTLDKVG